jgi:hypothetical protein
MGYPKPPLRRIEAKKRRLTEMNRRNVWERKISTFSGKKSGKKRKLLPLYRNLEFPEI